MKISQIKKKAKADMQGNYGLAILTMVLLNLVLVGSATLGLVIGVILVAGAVQCCYKAFYVDIALRKATGVDSTYRGFRQFAKALVANILLTLIYLGIVVAIAIIGVIFTFIPGMTIVMTLILSIVAPIVIIVISVKLKFVFFVMNHQTDLTAGQCIKRSWEITKGKFWKILLFELSFIGWYILVALTFGALSLYVLPYHDTACANLYLDLTANADGATYQAVEQE